MCYSCFQIVRFDLNHLINFSKTMGSVVKCFGYFAKYWIKYGSWYCFALKSCRLYLGCKKYRLSKVAAFDDACCHIEDFAMFCFGNQVCCIDCFELCMRCFCFVHLTCLDILYFHLFDQVLLNLLQFHHQCQLLHQVVHVQFYQDFRQFVLIYLFQKPHIQTLIFMLQRAHQIYLFLDQPLQKLKHCVRLNH